MKQCALTDQCAHLPLFPSTNWVLNLWSAHRCARASVNTCIWMKCCFSLALKWFEMFPPPSNKSCQRPHDHFFVCGRRRNTSMTGCMQTPVLCCVFVGNKRRGCECCAGAPSVPSHNQSQSLKELETLLCSGHWEIFPLHKNRNAYTFIEYSIFNTFFFFLWVSEKRSQLLADRTNSLLTVGNVPWPAVIPKQNIRLMAVIKRNDIDNVFIRGQTVLKVMTDGAIFSLCGR